MDIEYKLYDEHSMLKFEGKCPAHLAWGIIPFSLPIYSYAEILYNGKVFKIEYNNEISYDENISRSKHERYINPFKIQEE